MTSPGDHPQPSRSRRPKPTTRPATVADVDIIADFIRSLAAYENLSEKMVATPEDYAAAFFGDAPRVFCELGFIGDRPAGIAVWFYSFSTVLGRHGLYLEDIFVDPASRGQGVGKALLARLARRCVDEGLGRFEWTVLDWNAPSIAFYRSLGAAPMDEWTTQRLTGAALVALAGDIGRE